MKVTSPISPSIDGDNVKVVSIPSRSEPSLVAKSRLKSMLIGDLAGLTADDTDDDLDSDVVDTVGPLKPSDLPIGRPLAWRVVDTDGTLLLDAGAVLPTAADRDFLFAQFEPQREEIAENFVAPAEKSDDGPKVISLSDMGLTIGSRLGVRGMVGGVQTTYASRMIGLTPNELIFITLPVSSAGRLSLDPRDTVEVVAVSARAVYLFTCSVESVCLAPYPYVILSKPRIIRRLRERRAERIKTRFPVIFSGTPIDAAPVSGLGIANDISDLGMALSTSSVIGAVGDWLKIRFYLDMHSTTLCIETESEIRNVKASDAEGDGRLNYEYGLEFADLPLEQRHALRNFVLSHRSLG